MSYKTINVEEDVWEMIDKISNETGIPKKTLLRKIAEYLLNNEDMVWEILKGKRREKGKEVKGAEEVKTEERTETEGDKHSDVNNPAIGFGSRKIKI